MNVTALARRVASTLSLTLCLISMGAHAGSGCETIFNNTYPDSLTNDNARCLTCHQTSGGSGFNAYGADLRLNGAEGAGFSCAGTDFAAALVAVQDLDSDNEGNSNIVEINAGTQPGWCDTATSATCENTAGTLPNPPLDPPSDPPSDPAPENGAPIASAGGPYDGEAGTTLIQFDGTGSTDPDDDPLTYAWDFGDGNTATGSMPTHTYQAAGTFEVTLVVNDSVVDSDPSITSATIIEPVTNLAPTANAGGPYMGKPGVTVLFDGSDSTDPNGDVLTYAWDFGDGAMGDGVSPTHAYAAAGTYTAALVVNDGEFDSDRAEATVEIAEPIVETEGEALYNANCLFCHGDPWEGAAVDESIPGLRRVAGARSCNIYGSIFGTSVFPNGVPEMQFLQGITEIEIEAMAEYLNSMDTSGEQRYVTTCAGCHGNDGSGGRTDEDVYGESAGETWEAIFDEEEMHYLACMPPSDIEMIADYLAGFDDDDGVDDDEDSDDDSSGGGSPSVLLLLLLAIVARKITPRPSPPR